MERKRKIFLPIFYFMVLLVGSIGSMVRAEEATMNIRIIVGNTTLKAKMVDSPTTRDFLSLLPIEVTLEDYARTEKIAYLPRKLSTEGAPAGIDPSIGDITYYAPWGNLAIFYNDFGYSRGLILLGRIESGIEALRVDGFVPVRFERE
ncbi:MAG: cyclophilin-like fold protein [Spirochaetes bacterium]|nr:cyclophilin-like fold protein [Spirochaetota bacterium]